MTPLQAAICYEQSGAVVKAILKHKPSIALLDAQGNSVLHWAARNRHVSVLQEILKLQGVRELLKRNSEYWSPVEYACFEDGLAENMKTFLKWGLTPRMATMIRFPGEVSRCRASNAVTGSNRLFLVSRKSRLPTPLFSISSATMTRT